MDHSSRRRSRLHITLPLALGLLAGLTAAPPSSAAGAAATTAPPGASSSTSQAAQAPTAPVLLQVDGDPVTVTAKTPGQDGVVQFSAAAGQTVTVDLTATGFGDPCDVKVSLATPSGQVLTPASCAGDPEGTVLAPVAVKATALLRLTVDVADRATGSLSVHATGTGTQSLTPNAPFRTVTVPRAGHATVAFGIQRGDTLGFEIRAHIPEQSMDGIHAQLLRGATEVGPWRFARKGTMLWASTGQFTGELRLAVYNGGSEPVDVDISVTSTREGGIDLVPGATQTLGLRVLARTTTFTFDGTAGSRPVLDLTSTAEAGDSPSVITLERPNGSTVTSREVGRDQRSWQLPQLDATGTWRLVVRVGTGTGRLTMTLRVGTTEPRPVALGEPVAVSFDHDGQLTDLTVDSARGDLLSVEIGDFDVTTSDGTPAPVTVSGGRPDSDAVQRWDTVTEDAVLQAPAATPGTQQRRLRLTTVAAAQGTLTVTVTRTSATPRAITLGAAVAAPLDAATGDAVFSFPVSAGTVPIVSLTALSLKSPDGSAGVVAASGVLQGDAHGQGFGFRSSVGELRPARAIPRAGTFLLRVGARAGARGTVTFTVRSIRPTVTPLAVDGTATLHASPTAEELFSLPLHAGDRPFLATAPPEVTADGDVVLELRTPDGTVAGRAVWTGPGSLLLVRRPVPVTGTYTLRSRGHGEPLTVEARLDLAVTTSAGTVAEGHPVTLTAAKALHGVSLTVPARPGKVPYLTYDQTGLGDTTTIRLVDSRGDDDAWADDTGTTTTITPNRRRGAFTFVLTPQADGAVRTTVSLRYAGPIVRTLTSDAPVRVKLKQPVPEIRLTFEAKRGNRFAVLADTVRFVWADHRLAYPRAMQLLRPDGSVFQPLDFHRRSTLLRDIELDADGRWTIDIVTPGPATGLVKLTHSVGTARTATVKAGSDVTATFAAAADTVRWTIPLAAGHSLSLPVTRARLAATDGAGSPVTGRVTVSLSGAPCPATVEVVQDAPHPLCQTAVHTEEDTQVTLTLAPVGLTTGTVVVHPYDWVPLPPTSLGLGVPAATTIAVPQRPVAYTVTVPEGRYVLRLDGIDLSGAGAHALEADLSRPSGNPDRVRVTPAEGTPPGETFAEAVELPAGTWTLRLTGVDDTTGSFTTTLLAARDVRATASTSTSAVLDRPGDRAVVTMTAPSAATAATTFRMDRVAGPGDAGAGAVSVTAVDAKGRTLTCPTATPSAAWCEAAPRLTVTYPVTLTLTPFRGGTGTWRVSAAGTNPQRLAAALGTTTTVSVPAAAAGQDVELTVPDIPSDPVARVALVVTDWSATDVQAPDDVAPAVTVAFDTSPGTTWGTAAAVTGPATVRSGESTSLAGEPLLVHLRTVAAFTGTFSVTAVAVTDEIVHGALGEPFAATIDHPAMWSTYTFGEGEWGDTVTVQARSATLAAYRICLGARGDDPCSDVLSAGDGEARFSLASSHEVTIRPEGLGTGTVEITVTLN